jgi:fructose-6-phosphate aldolase 1
MFELYLDTADAKQVARFNTCLPIKGVTTNPSIIAITNLNKEKNVIKIQNQFLVKPKRHKAR